jgi:DNA repair protein RadC
MTNAIQSGCKAIGIKLLDHVILTEENYCSFADEGLI